MHTLPHDAFAAELQRWIDQRDEPAFIDWDSEEMQLTRWYR